MQDVIGTVVQGFLLRILAELFADDDDAEHRKLLPQIGHQRKQADGEPVRLDDQDSRLFF
nr:hypothetical protein [Herbaspirillum sp. B39]